MSSLFEGKTVTGPISARIVIDGESYLNFYGSGYLALADLPEVRAAALGALEDGTSFSQQISAALGVRNPYFDDVERLGATALGSEAAVYLPSGYLIGIVAFASLETSFDRILIDEGAHYSLKDAARLSELPTFTFAHCDAASLKDQLTSGGGRGRPLILTDGVFATTGRIPPLADYATVLETSDGRMLIDESHAFGVVGRQGHGAAEHCGVEAITIVGATLSKAFCAQGALVGCSAQAAEVLRFKPQVRGACAGSPISAAVATASLRYGAAHPDIRTQLRTLADDLRTKLRGLGLEVIDSPAPIVSFKFGTRSDMLALQQRAWQHGIFLYHSTYLGAGEEGMIRCAVFRDHTQADIDTLIDVLSM